MPARCRLRGKKLFLAVDSPAWMQQLSLLKPEIIEKVNAALGKEAVKEITLNIGEVQPVRSPASRPVQVAGLLPNLRRRSARGSKRPLPGCATRMSGRRSVA